MICELYQFLKRNNFFKKALYLGNKIFMPQKILFLNYTTQVKFESQDIKPYLLTSVSLASCHVKVD